MLDKMLAILRVIAILNALKAEEGRYRLGEISQWARMPRATCDRKLRQMVEMKLLIESEGRFKGSPCRLFSISEDGQKIIEIYAV